MRLGFVEYPLRILRIVRDDTDEDSDEGIFERIGSCYCGSDAGRDGGYI